MEAEGASGACGRAVGLGESLSARLAWAVVDCDVGVFGCLPGSAFAQNPVTARCQAFERLGAFVDSAARHGVSWLLSSLECCESVDTEGRNALYPTSATKRFV